MKEPVEIPDYAQWAFSGDQDAAKPVWLVRAEDITQVLAALSAQHRRWAETVRFRARAGETLWLQGRNGDMEGALFGLGDEIARARHRFITGRLPTHLPCDTSGKNVWRFMGEAMFDRATCEEYALGWLLGAYAFRPADRARDRARLVPPEKVEAPALMRQAKATFLARDLINLPANQLGPADLEAYVRAVGALWKAEVRCIIGEDLCTQNYPLIHAVGRAGGQAPRLIDLRWGRKGAPKLTLVGKGVTFDSGGLDMKSRQAMRQMKKDMGGAAAAIALAMMIMESGLDLRLRLLVPSVENGVGIDAFRPGDLIRSRSGMVVEIGDTDAEGRLILADALCEADSEAPEWLFDFATLTGAARVAMGADIVPFFTDDDALAARLAGAGERTRDPLWRMPLWAGYESKLASPAADLVNTPAGGMGGAIMAALFLRRFVKQAKMWAHFDLFGWTPRPRAFCPEGGECQAARAAFHLLAQQPGGAEGATHRAIAGPPA